MSAEFVDTNVILYAFSEDEPVKRERAQSLLERLWESGTGRLSTQVLQEFYVNATRKLARALSSEEAQAIVLSLSQWGYHRPDAQDILAAAVLAERHRISFWDALIVHSAEALGANLLWSEDLNPGQRFGALEVRNPFQEN
jgi:predicted nucleic acid-binding protein